MGGAPGREAEMPEVSGEGGSANILGRWGLEALPTLESSWAENPSFPSPSASLRSQVHLSRIGGGTSRSKACRRPRSTCGGRTGELGVTPAGLTEAISSVDLISFSIVHYSF